MIRAKRRDGFLRTIAILLAGTAASQLLIIAATPFLTRLYTPSEFGLAAVYVAAIGVLGVVAALRYDIAIPVARDEPTGLSLLAIALVMSLVIGLVCGLLTLTAGGALLSFLNAEPLAGLLWLFPLGVSATGIQQAMTYWALRGGSSGVISSSRIGQSGALVLGQLGAGALGTGPIGLIASHPVGRVVGAAVLAPLVPWRRLTALSAGQVLAVVSSYRRFPLLTAWSGLINAVGLQAPIVLLAAIYGAPEAGAFFLTVRVLQAPAALAGQAVGQAFFSHASRAEPGMDRRRYAIQTYEGMLALATGPALLLVAIGPAGFEWVFGPEWSEAGAYAAWLAPWTLLVFAASPISTAVLLTSRQGVELAFQVALLVLRGAALVAGAALGGPSTSVALFGVISVAMWLPYAVWLLSLSGVAAMGAVRITVRSLATGAASAAPAGLAVAFDMPLPMIIAAGLVSIGLYVATLRFGLVRLRHADP